MVQSQEAGESPIKTVFACPPVDKVQNDSDNGMKWEWDEKNEGDMEKMWP